MAIRARHQAPSARQIRRRAEQEVRRQRGRRRVASAGAMVALAASALTVSGAATPAAAATPAPAVGSAANAQGGGWTVTAAGTVASFGGSPAYGDLSGTALNQPIVGMASTPDGGGYWLAASDGGIFAFGDASFHGSTGNLRLAKPVVGMASTPDGGGYWLAASDGGIFAFGDASFHGSVAGQDPAPVTSITRIGDGYALVDSSGDEDTLPAGDTAADYRTPAPTPVTVPTSATPTPAAASTPSPTPTSHAVTGGINLDGIYEGEFNKMTTAQQTAVINQIASLGITWIRVDVPFGAVEPSPGTFNWYPDAEIRLAAAAGIHVDALISYPPSWAQLSDGSANPAAFGQFAGAAAAHLRSLGVSTYEIMNEPNIAGNWSSNGTVNVAQYTSVLQDSYAAIKAAEPASTVISAGLADAVDATGSVSPATFVAQMYAAGAKGYFDAVGMHPYSFPDMPMQADSWNQFASGIPAIRALMVANGDAAKQIWLTEYGAPTQGNDAVSYATQASMISAAFAAASSWSYLGPVFLYNYQDDAVDGSDSYGLYTITGAPKPAVAAVEQALQT